MSDNPNEVKLDYKAYSWYNETFLVADDDQYSRMLLERILKKAGAKVIAVQNGTQAIARLKADKSITLAVLDLLMPEHTGYEVAEYCAKKRPGVILIACTADVVRLDREYCFQLGFSACINKPFLPIRLLKAIEKVLERREELKEN